ncbi:MAG: GNAT family N-acetyltransferase, partial [Chloroflexota bacterium]|nr:GNAT family N-acetyltransferase [Chloroflexota bacterium]
NRAWADTWNFRPIPMAALAADLDGQREGFLLALEKPQERVIAGTVHAIFDRTAKNPDDGPHAWISNLTVIPTWRGRGLGRALLAAGLHHLAGRGARSAGLGVDGGNPVPVSLYRSVGFEVIDTMELWERPISAPSAGGLA